MDYLKKEGEGQTIRLPSVANLMIDALDRDIDVYPSPFEFQITKQANLQNGFFTRIAATEVVLEWCEPNINGEVNNREIAIDISGVGIFSVQLPIGFYTVEQTLDAIVDRLNVQSGTTGCTFSIVQAGRATVLDCSGGDFFVMESPLGNQLEFPTDDTYRPQQPVGNCPDLRLVRYLDFVSEQLTYAQKVKDTATNPYDRNVLLRWYMAWDEQPQLDGYGFPILMGYTDFVARRLFSPPKQIRWENTIPIGNLGFSVYNEDGVIMTEVAPSALYSTSFLMTLQLSEN